jgi:hypothetical protein
VNSAAKPHPGSLTRRSIAPTSNQTFSPWLAFLRRQPGEGILGADAGKVGVSLPVAHPPPGNSLLRAV